MKIVKKKIFNASSKDLWEIFHDPGNMPAWNPKCVSSETLNTRGKGQRFNATFEMNRKRRHAQGEVLEYTNNERIRFRYY